MSALTCSIARAVRKQPAAETNGRRPPLASPAATPTMSCSAIPTFTVRAGNSFWNAPSLEEPTESFTTATMRSSARARSARVAAQVSRQSWVTTASLAFPATAGASEATATHRGCRPGATSASPDAPGTTDGRKRRERCDDHVRTLPLGRHFGVPHLVLRRVRLRRRKQREVRPQFPLHVYALLTRPIEGEQPLNL